MGRVVVPPLHDCRVETSHCRMDQVRDERRRRLGGGRDTWWVVKEVRSCVGSDVGSGVVVEGRCW